MIIPAIKLVKNLSSTPLTQAQSSLLAKGCKYAIAPRHPLHLEYMFAIESVCLKQCQQDVEESRVNVNRVPPPNLTLVRQKYRQ